MLPYILKFLIQSTKRWKSMIGRGSHTRPKSEPDDFSKTSSLRRRSLSWWKNKLFLLIKKEKKLKSLQNFLA